ncbi:hypothetical protein [Vulcanisaeta souniana]|uniref:Uncharacterized protein n=1 Tax=Vulcanisaeta souniana JCM 11219 TaxID=1293586 RepID=A0A830E1I2_9CREN|nr:hypothetical protein [Vulcanisaeta souniana]BDR91469.1 hypothetical protein Vsou_05620 [Vulcanisaeta souniana JCM 11219]GGI73398.1 hypothetical protein GCM10007112_07820 [Vulcanisaeta souniana JCM 11219]
MSKRARKKEESKEQGTVSITSFLYGTEEKPRTETKPATKPTEAKAAETKIAEKAAPQQSSGIEDAILSHIMSRGVIAKEELMAWGKSKGLRVADILKAIENLSGRGRIRKRLNDKGNLIYEYVK